MGFAPLIIAGVSAAVTAYGQHKAAQAQQNAAEYNAQVADQNAKIALQKAKWTSQNSEQAVGNSEIKTGAQLGGIKTYQAASGVDVNSGSALQVQNSARTIGKMDALTIRSNAARQAYGYQVENISYRDQGILDRYGGNEAIAASNIAIAQTGLKFASQAASYGGGGGGAAGAAGGGGASSTMLSSYGGSNNDAWNSYSSSNSTLGA